MGGGRVGGRARKPEEAGKEGGQVKNNPLRLGSSRALSPRSVPEDSRRWRWGGQSGIPPSSAGRCPPARRNCVRGRAPGPPRPAGAPLPGTGRSWRRRKLRSGIHYLRALIGLRRGRGHGGDQGTRARDAEGGPCRRGEGSSHRPRCWGRSSAWLLSRPHRGGAERREGSVWAFDCGRRLLSLASSPFPGRWEGSSGCTPRPARLAAAAAAFPDAARASFIIIFGQVECARNSCFTRLTSEERLAGIREMNDGGRGGAQPRSRRGPEEARGVSAASASWRENAPSLLPAPAIAGLRPGRPRRAGARLAGPVPALLLGSAGWAAETAARHLWWRFRIGAEAGKSGGGGRGNTNREVKFYLPLRESCGFSPAAAGALPLSYTPETSVAGGGGGGGDEAASAPARPHPRLPLGGCPRRVNPADAGAPTRRPRAAWEAGAGAEGLTA